jgi:peptidyl-prolyl cis-trans isomerase B (cyclophilin B)
MKQLLAIVILALTGLMPATAFTQDNNPDAKGTGMVTVTMQSSKGVITLELDGDKAPDTVANFVAYANAGHYDGTIFHRVIPGFMIQGGGFDTSMNQKSTNAPVKNEANNGLKNVNGSIAMARTNDPHSATAQFFINVKDNTFLDHTSPDPRGWGYAVFGQVTDGMDVVQSIEAVPTGNKSGHQDVPLESVVIEKVTISE